MGKNLLAMYPGAKVRHYKNRKEYQILHLSLGCSPEIHNRVVIVYQDVLSKSVFTRTAEDFTASIQLDNGEIVDRFEEVK